MRVYLEGLERWKAEGKPIERGERGSGDLIQ